MATTKGKLIECDKCGEKVFLKLIGKDYYDGGYSSQDKFEEMPENWLYRALPLYCYLCPTCNREITKILKEFWGEKSERYIKDEYLK